MSKKLYRILENKEGVYYEASWNYKYGTEGEFIGKQMTYEYFDANKKYAYGDAFRALDVNGLVNGLRYNKGNNVVFEALMSGREVEYDKYHRRYERQEIIRRLTSEEVKTLIKQQSDKMDWNYYKACYPLDPRAVKVGEIDEEVVELLKKWSLKRTWVCESTQYAIHKSDYTVVRYSMMNAVWNSIEDSLWIEAWNSIKNTVRASVGYSLWQSIRKLTKDVVEKEVKKSVEDIMNAYISSLYPNVKKWKHTTSNEGVNPFQSGIELLNKGFVPSFDGDVWRLHAGEDCKVVFEISESELYN